MSSYQQLAGAYDELTWDVGYEKRADFLEKLFRRSRIPVHTVLDLACGTGAMTWLLTGRGYELIAVDGSEDMLAAAMGKSGTVEGVAPIFLHQSMPRLDLYGTVDAAICCLDSLNYLTEPEDCRKTFHRVWRALRPGGMFFFDINTPQKLRGLDGQVFLDENDESYCVWRAEFDEEENCCYYGIDLFRRRGALWARSFEQHCEYAYDPDTLEQWLREAGFARVECFGDRTLTPPGPDEQRMYFAAWKE